MLKTQLKHDNAIYLYNTTIQVRINDINYGNHVGNDAFVSMLQEVRMQWLKTLNLSELFLGDEQVGMIQTGLTVKYLRECFYGELLNFKLYVQEVSSKGFELYYECEKTENEKTKYCLVATTQMLSYNYEIKKIVSIPQQLMFHFSK